MSLPSTEDALRGAIHSDRWLSFMSTNSSSSMSNPLSIYRLYLDDVEEIFFNRISMRSMLIGSLLVALFTFASVLILLYRSTKIFLACFIPCIYSLIAYDFLQFASIVLLKWNLNQKYFVGELCRWPSYLKASSEAGQCLTLLLLYVIRRQKLRYFFKHHHLPNSSRIHARALTLVALLFIVYVNNWITHLKVEKIHLITSTHSNNSITIEEYPITLYDSSNDSKMTDRRQFYVDLERFAAHSRTPLPTRTAKPEKIIHTQKDDSIHEIIIKIRYSDFFRPKKKSLLGSNITRRRLGIHRNISKNNSYRVHRCTYGQRNFFLANLISLIHALFYLILISYFLTSICRQRIPRMTVAYHRTLHDRAVLMGRKKSADRHQQLILLTHLRHFQYLIVYCHTAFMFIRLIYVCLLTLLLWFVQSPFQWSAMKMLVYGLFLVVYYSIPLRILLLFLYLFLSLFSSYIYSIFYYLFHTKLHFSCRLQKPSIRFGLHLAEYHQREIHPEEHSTNSLMMELASSVYDEHSTAMPMESGVFGEEMSSGQHGMTSSVLAIIHLSEQSNTVI